MYIENTCNQLLMIYLYEELRNMYYMYIDTLALQTTSYKKMMFFFNHNFNTFIRVINSDRILLDHIRYMLLKSLFYFEIILEISNCRQCFPRECLFFRGSTVEWFT